jgi:serine/threonine-protein kinase
MAKRPEDRYQTALEMRQDLERARAGAPVTAGIPLASQQTRTMGVARGSAADAPTTVLDRRTAVTPVRATRAGGAAGAVGAPAQERPRRWRMALFVLATLALGGIVAWVVVRAVEVPPVPSTTLPPITTLTPEGDATSTSELSTTSSVPSTTEQQTSSTAAPPTTSATTSPNSTLSPIVTVPSVIGQRVGRATETLQSAGLKVFRQNVRVNDRSRANRVVNQLPRGGQQVARDSTVVIFVGEFSNG